MTNKYPKKTKIKLISASHNVISHSIHGAETVSFLNLSTLSIYYFKDIERVHTLKSGNNWHTINASTVKIVISNFACHIPNYVSYCLATSTEIIPLIEFKFS